MDGTNRVAEPIREIEPEQSVLSAQAEEQRAAMLRELAQQRERMRASGAITAAGDESVGEPVEAELARLPEDAGQPSSDSSPTGATVEERDDLSPAEKRKLGLIP